MQELFETVGEFTPNKLIIDPTYPQQIGSGVFADQEEPAVIKRGQLLAKDETGKLVLASAENKENLSICLIDTVVTNETVVEVLLAGAVGANGVIVGESEDVYDYKDSLRSCNIYLKNTVGGM